MKDLKRLASLMKHRSDTFSKAIYDNRSVQLLVFSSNEWAKIAGYLDSFSLQVLQLPRTSPYKQEIIGIGEYYSYFELENVFGMCLGSVDEVFPVIDTHRLLQQLPEGCDLTPIPPEECDLIQLIEFLKTKLPQII